MLIAQIDEAVASTLKELGATDVWRTYVGPPTEDLVHQLQRQFGLEHAGLCSSGTAALELVLRGLGVASDAEVLLSAYDYPGNFWAIERIGALPVLVDVAPDGWSISLEHLEASVSTRCKALVVSHLHGQLQDTKLLAEWCQRHSIALVEDACQAVGALIEGRSLGSHADAMIVSFGGGKVISCGRGGAWMTNDHQLAQRIRVAAGAGSGPYLMSSLQAAIVLAQLPFLEPVNHQCRQFFSALNAMIFQRGVPWLSPVDVSRDTCRAYYQAGWLLAESAEANCSDDLDREGWLVRLNGCPFPETCYRPKFGTGFPGFHRRSARRCRSVGHLPNTRSIAERTIVLHHRIALDPHMDATHLADWIAGCIPPTQR